MQWEIAILLFQSFFVTNIINKINYQNNSIYRENTTVVSGCNCYKSVQIVYKMWKCHSWELIFGSEVISTKNPIKRNK